MDTLLIAADSALRTLFARPRAGEPSPARSLPAVDLSVEQRRLSSALMRVNHVVEVCAQALYQGQSLTARDESNRAALQHAAQEEVEHLAWTERRIQDLGGRTSLLNPVWYASSLAVGVAAGMLGDKWNLGFLEETEHQVTRHLEEHLQGLPEQDAKSRAIVEQMREDEMKHAHMAQEFGAAPLPKPVKDVMAAMSKVMTTISYKI